MSSLSQRYYLRPAAAHVRASEVLAGNGTLALSRSLDTLPPDHLEEIVRLGLEAGVEGMFRFKRSGVLPRVGKVIGMLRGIHPASLLDVGSGRGAFLWPLVQALPALPVTAVDVDLSRLREVRGVRRGGVTNLMAHVADVCALPFVAGAFDMVTVLEVLEHLEHPAQAASEVLRVARRFVIISVPSRPDDNPQHLHLLDGRTITRLFADAGAHSVSMGQVHNHLVGLVRVSRESSQ